MWHMGGSYVANKELKITSVYTIDLYITWIDGYVPVIEVNDCHIRAS